MGVARAGADPHPPIVMGAAPGPRTLEDIVEYRYGWIPLAGRHDIVSQIETVPTAVTAARRDPDEFEITAHGAMLEQLETLQDAGDDRAVFTLPLLGEGAVIPKLDEWSRAIGL